MTREEKRCQDPLLKKRRETFFWQLTVARDSLNRATSYTYTANSPDLTRIDFADGSNNQFSYDPTFHKLAMSQDGNGNATRYTYDPTNADLLTITDALNHTTTQTWSNGLLQSVTDPLGQIG